MSVILFTVSVAISPSPYYSGISCSEIPRCALALLHFVEDVGVRPGLRDHLGHRLQADLLEEVAEADALDELADALAVLPVLAPQLPHGVDELLEVLVRRLELEEGDKHGREQGALDDRRLGAHEDRRAAILARGERLGHHVDAVHAAHAVAVVDVES